MVRREKYCGKQSSISLKKRKNGKIKESSHLFLLKHKRKQFLMIYWL
jgi:hypothetical protein